MLRGSIARLLVSTTPLVSWRARCEESSTFPRNNGPIVLFAVVLIYHFVCVELYDALLSIVRTSMAPSLAQPPH